MWRERDRHLTLLHLADIFRSYLVVEEDLALLSDIPAATPANGTILGGIPSSTTADDTFFSGIPSAATAHDALFGCVSASATAQDTLFSGISTPASADNAFFGGIPSTATANNTLLGGISNRKEIEYMHQQNQYNQYKYNIIKLSKGIGPYSTTAILHVYLIIWNRNVQMTKIEKLKMVPRTC